MTTNLLKTKNGVCSPMLLIATVLFIAAAIAPSPRGVEAQRTFHACFIFSGDITDIGYTFTTNRNRADALKAVKDLHPTHSFFSKEYFGFSARPDKRDVFQRMLYECNMIVSTSSVYLRSLDIQSMLRNYTNVTMFQIDGNQVRKDIGVDPNRPSNLIYYSRNLQVSHYNAGVVAAAQAKRCVGFIAPLGDGSFIGGPANAMFRGMRAVNGSLPLEIVISGTFYDVDIETQAAEVLSQGRKCDVIAHFQNTRSANLYIERHFGDSEGGTPKVWSIGQNSDVGQYIGASVLTSTMFDYVDYFTKILNSTFNGENVDQYWGSVNGVSVISPLTSKAPLSVAAALQKHQVFDYPKGNGSVFCSDMYDSTGKLRMALNGSSCVKPSRTNDVNFFEYGIIIHGFLKMPSSCPAGSFYTYKTDVVPIQLLCVKCTGDTHTTKAGSKVCVPCHPNEKADLNKTICVITEVKVMSSFPVYGLVIIIIVPLLMLAAVVVLVTRLNTTRSDPRSGSFVPQTASGSQVAIAFIAVDDKLSPHWRSCGVAKIAQVYDQLSNTIQTVCVRNKVYIPIVVGDLHMLCHRDPGTLLNALVEIATRVDSCTTFPVPIRIKTGMHVGAPRAIRHAREHAPVEYVGDDVRIARNVFRFAEGGQLLVCLRNYAPPVELQSGKVVRVGGSMIDSNSEANMSGPASDPSVIAAEVNLVVASKLLNISDSAATSPIREDESNHAMKNPIAAPEIDDDLEDDSAADEEKRGDKKTGVRKVSASPTAGSQQQQQPEKQPNPSGSSADPQVGPTATTGDPQQQPQQQQRLAADGTGLMIQGGGKPQQPFIPRPGGGNTTAAAASTGAQRHGRSGPSSATRIGNDVLDMIDIPTAVISVEEFQIAATFAYDTLKSFLQLVPPKDCLSIVTSVCMRLNVPTPPTATSANRKTNLRFFLLSVKHIAVQIVHSFEARELQVMIEQWTAAADARSRRSYVTDQ